MEHSLVKMQGTLGPWSGNLRICGNLQPLARLRFRRLQNRGVPSMAGCEDGGHGFLGHLNDVAPGAHRDLSLGGLSCCDCKKGASPKKGMSEAHCC